MSITTATDLGFDIRPNSQKPNAALYAQFRQAHVHPTDVPSPSSSDSTAAVTQSNHTYPPKERRVPFSFHDSNLSRRSSPFNRIESDKPRHEPPIAPSLFDDRILGSVSRPIDPFSESSRGYSATDAEREDHWAPINTARLADDPTHDGLIHASTSVQPFGVWSDLPILDTTCSLGDTQLPPLSDSLPGLSHPYFYPETTASLLREEKPLDFLTMQDQADLGGTAMPYNQSFTTSGAADIAIPSQDLSTHRYAVPFALFMLLMNLFISYSSSAQCSIRPHTGSAFGIDEGGRWHSNYVSEQSFGLYRHRP